MKVGLGGPRGRERRKKRTLRQKADPSTEQANRRTREGKEAAAAGERKLRKEMGQGQEHDGVLL